MAVLLALSLDLPRAVWWVVGSVGRKGHCGVALSAAVWVGSTVAWRELPRVDCLAGMLVVELVRRMAAHSVEKLVGLWGSGAAAPTAAMLAPMSAPSMAALTDGSSAAHLVATTVLDSAVTSVV